LSTQDQKQICTGKHGSNRIASDDCESQASIAYAVLKAILEETALLIKMGFFDLYKKCIHSGEGFDSLVSNPDLIKLADKIMPEATWGAMPNKIYYIILLMQIHEIVSAKVVCAIGSANAAGIGQEKHLSGHCYLMMAAHTTSNPKPQLSILEVLV
jgi:hypothetical protein